MPLVRSALGWGEAVDASRMSSYQQNECSVMLSSHDSTWALVNNKTLRWLC